MLLFRRKPQLYRCNVCKEEFPFEGIKYSKGGDGTVCKSCYEKDIEKKAKEKSTSAIVEDIIRVICMDCNYRFSWRKKSKVQFRMKK